MALGNHDERCSVSAFCFVISLLFGCSLSYPLTRLETTDKCSVAVNLDDCFRVPLDSNPSLLARLPRGHASRRATNVAACLLDQTTTTQPAPSGPPAAATGPSFQPEQIKNNFTACLGSIELERQTPFAIQLWHQSSTEGSLYVLFPWENYEDLLSSFHLQPEALTVKFSCQAAPSICVKLSLSDHKTHTYGDSHGYKDASILLVKRDAHERVQQSLPSGTNLSFYHYVLLVTVGVLALAVASAVCVKGQYDVAHRAPASSKKDSSSHTNQQEMSVLSNGLPSPSSPVENNDPNTASSPKGVESEEVRISMGFPDSPSSLDETEHEKKRVSHGSTSSPPVSDEGRSRRSQEPLPQPPVFEAAEAAAPLQPDEVANKPKDQQDEEEEDEPPYDYAHVPGQDQEEGSSQSENEDQDNGGKKEPGKYGKVTRHSGVPLPSQETSYAEVKDLVERRERSVTEPVDPSSVRDPMPLPRTYTDSGSASHLPLPAIPSFRVNPEQNVTEEDEDDMYDSVKDDVKEAAIRAAAVEKKKQELYEAVDEMDQDDSEMYESVPEELKEGLQPIQPSPAVQPPTLKSTRMTVYPNGSPSPTKRLGSDSTAPPDSPGVVKRQGKKLAKDAMKKEKRKSKIEDDDDGSKAKKQTKELGKREKRKSRPEDEEDSGKGVHFSIFGRKKSRSITAGIGKGRKDFKQVESPPPTSPLSPEHHPPSIPPPAVPSPCLNIPLDDDEDDDSMYDSVTVPRPLSSDWSPTQKVPVEAAKAKSASLPSSARSTGLTYNSWVNEPLPEVPEDSGSALGSEAFIIKHKRMHEPGDPRYDIISASLQGVPPSKSTPGQVEDLGVDPEYDTVVTPQTSAEKSEQQHDEEQIEHQYAQAFKTPVGKSNSISHDDLGYAMVDPDIIVRKRTASLQDGHTLPLSGTESRYHKVLQPSLTATAEPSLSPPNADKVPVMILGSSDPGYDSIKNSGDKSNGVPPPGSDKVPFVILASDDPGYDSVKGTASSEAKPVSGIDRMELPPVPEDPGYESVSKLLDDDKFDPGYDQVSSRDEEDSRVIETRDMYAQVDLIRKRVERLQKMDSTEMESLDVASDSERLRTPSPAPPIPPIGDLGDLSEFDPPPIPRQNLDVSLPELEERPYSKVMKKGGSIEVVDDVPGYDVPGYTAVDIITPEDKGHEGVETSDDLTSGYAAVDEIIPPEKRRDILHPTASEPESSSKLDNLIPQIDMTLKHSTEHQSVSNGTQLQLTPTDDSSQHFQPEPLENSDRMGEHVYDVLDKDDDGR